MVAQANGQVQQVHGDEPVAEGYGNGTEIKVDEVNILREGGGRASGGGGAVQIPGAYPGPDRL